MYRFARKLTWSFGLELTPLKSLRENTRFGQLTFNWHPEITWREEQLFSGKGRGQTKKEVVMFLFFTAQVVTGCEDPLTAAVDFKTSLKTVKTNLLSRLAITELKLQRANIGFSRPRSKSNASKKLSFSQGFDCFTDWNTCEVDWLVNSHFYQCEMINSTFRAILVKKSGHPESGWQQFYAIDDLTSRI